METLLSTAGAHPLSASQISDLLPPGAKAGPWVVERELGRGGMGTVYAVVHEGIGKRAALKVVHRRLLGTGFNPERMLVEARVVNQVGHPNIVDIFETGHLPDDRPYIVMERLEGQSLAQRADDGRVPPDLVIAILRQLCDGLIAAHAAGIVHRDLKLDNVFLIDNLDDPSTPRVKILDWGIAKVVHEDTRHTVEGQLVGTPQYLSPEQARGGKVTPKTDVYSLGVMAYELFLEQLPFEAETSAEIMAMHLRLAPPPPSELWPDIPPQLERLLLDMLAKRADHRPSMLEVANRLEDVRQELERRRKSSQIAAQARPASISAPIPVQLPPTGASAEGSRPRRRPLADAHAPTKLAQTRWRWLPYWRYLAGGLAILGCVVMILLSRGGDRIAAAAKAPAAGVEARPTATPLPTATPRHAATPRPAAAPVLELVALPGSELAALSPEPLAGAADAATLATVEPPAKKRPRSHAARSSAKGASSKAAVRRVPAAPRRGVQLDPDGTIDPYR